MPTLGSRNYFHPESPLLQMITWSTEGFQRYSLMFSRDFEPVAFAMPYHRNIPMDKYIHLSFLLLFLVDLVITRYPEIPSIVPRIFCAYWLAVPRHLNTRTDNSSLLPSIRSSPVVHVFHISPQNTIRFSENPQQPIALEIGRASCRERV